jgi:hypothetical protein
LVGIGRLRQNISRLNISHHFPALHGCEKRPLFHPRQASVDLGRPPRLAPKLPSRVVFPTTLSLYLVLIVDLRSYGNTMTLFLTSAMSHLHDEHTNGKADLPSHGNGTAVRQADMGTSANRAYSNPRASEPYRKGGVPGLLGRKRYPGGACLSWIPLVDPGTACCQTRIGQVPFLGSGDFRSHPGVWPR